MTATTAETGGLGIMLTDDLIFFSRVAATARAHGHAVRQARTTAAAIEMARQTAPLVVLVDLQNESLDLPRFLEELRAACPAVPRTIAFGSHVEAATLKAAREAGCDRVAARSLFVRELETELPKWLARG